MKLMYITIVLLMLSVLCIGQEKREEQRNKSEIRGDLIFIKGEAKPFTGFLTEIPGVDEGDIMLEYKNGLAEGWHRYWYLDGSLESEHFMVKGKQNGISRTYHAVGELKLESESWYTNGLEEGASFFWYPTGILKYVGAFSKGERIGTHFWFFPNGAKKEIANFREDKLHGISLKWNEKGEVVEREFYYDGEKVEERIWLERNGVKDGYALAGKVKQKGKAKERKSKSPSHREGKN